MDAMSATEASAAAMPSQMERTLSHLMAEHRQDLGGVEADGLARVGETDSQREVWYEYINADTSAMAVTLPTDAGRLRNTDGERLVWRPGAGLEGWTTMRDVLSSESVMPPAAAGGDEQRSSDSTADVSDFTHGIHVRHDPRTGGLSGLPEGWAGLLPQGCAPNSRPSEEIPATLRPPAATPGMQLVDGPIVGTPYNISKWRPQFGLPLEACEFTAVNGYRIPSILVLLWRNLKASNGFLEEGIFRISADNEETKSLVKAINSSGEALQRISGATNAHLLANLIKIWFRQLPDDSKLVTADMIERILREGALDSTDLQASGKACMDLLRGFPPLRQGVFLWLLELMADVSSRKDVNFMSEQNIAIVLAPNLYHGTGSFESADPMAAVKAMASFCEKLLIYFVAVRSRVRSRSIDEAAEPTVPRAAAIAAASASVPTPVPPPRAPSAGPVAPLSLSQPAATRAPRPTSDDASPSACVSPGAASGEEGRSERSERGASIVPLGATA